MTAEALSVRQRQVLAFIRTSIAERGYPPSLREIGRGIGISPSSVAYHLCALEQKGLLRREYDRSRAITLTDTAERACADPRVDRYREALEELAKDGCISGHQHPHCWDCYTQVRDWCYPCVAQHALDPWIGREAQA